MEEECKGCAGHFQGPHQVGHDEGDIEEEEGDADIDEGEASRARPNITITSYIHNVLLCQLIKVLY